MKYNEKNIMTASVISQLEDDLEKLENEITNFKINLQTKFENYGLEINQDHSLLEAINKLKQLDKIDPVYGSIYDGTAYDIANESINKNEIKAVVLVKPGQRIEFNLGLKSYIKPADQFKTGANQFITVDWGDGVATQGNKYFCHKYENISDSLKPFNDEYKQAIITIKPTCYLEDEDTLMPLTIAFTDICKNHVIGISVNFVGMSSEYYTPVTPTISMSEYRNLRHYYTTEAYLNNNSFLSCHRLKKIKSSKLIITNTSYSSFLDCWSLETIDADIIVDKNYDNTSRYSMFQNCYNLISIKNLNLGQVTVEANYDKLFANCFKLKEIPGLIIDCSISKTTTCEFFYNCMSLENPFKYLININALQYAYRLFYGCHQIVEAPEELDFSLVNNASGMFERCINMRVAPKRLYLDNVTDCNNLFHHCWSLEESPLILTTNIDCSNASNLFAHCYSLTNVNCDLIFPNVVNAYSSIFKYCYSLINFNSNILKLGNNNVTTANVDSNRYVFQHSYNLKKLPKQELSIRYLQLCSTVNNVNIEEFPDTITMGIRNANALYSLKTLAKVKKMPKIINIVETTSTVPLFSGSVGITEINDLVININEAANISAIFQNCYELKTINNLIINAPNATNISSMFQNCYNLKTLNNVQINVKPDTAIDMSYLFDGCRSLSEIPDIGIDYQSASRLAYTFKNTSIKEAVFENAFNKITYMYSLFQQCYCLEKIKMYIKNDVTEYGYWINELHSLKEVDLDFELPNSTRNIFNQVTFGSNLTKFKLDLHNSTYASNAAFNLSNQVVLNDIQLLNWANTGNITLDTNSQLKKIIITFKNNVSANIYLRNGKLSAQALNDFFTNLPTVSGKTLYLKGQVNIDECDKTIATKKGWTINTTT